MYALTSSMKGTGRRFANMVFKKADVNVCKYSSHALDMKFRDDIDDLDHEHLKKIRVSVNPPFQASSIFSVNSRPNLNPPTRNMSTTAAAALPVADSGSGGVARIGEGKKVTKIETNVSVKINLNGSGIADCNSGIPLLDEMLHQFASHGLFDVHVKATGDIHVDQRHTNEDVAIAIGTALQQALGDDDRKKGINRFGNFIVPLDDALVHVSLDLSGRGPHLNFNNTFLPNDVQLVKEFFKSLVNTSGITLHIRNLYRSTNIIEPIFLAFAGALRRATEYDPNWRGVARIGEVKKVTKIETNVSVKINLDGSGVGDSNCGIPFLDEMLHQFASHGLFDVHVKATGDIHVDQRHTNEDVALAIGTALQQALGDKKEYINRFGSFCATHNGALVHAALDLSGHPHLGCRFDYFGTYTELVKPFFESLVNTTGMTLHIRKLSRSNSRHIIEATFKAFAGALRQAIEYDPRRRPRGDGGTLPSSKGVLSQ